MTILPKKKQQSGQQQQDGRHGGGNVGGRSIEESSGVGNSSGTNPTSNPTPNASATSVPSLNSNNAIPSFLSTTSTGPVSALSPAHYVGDVASSVGGAGSGSGTSGISGGTRRQPYGLSHSSCHDGTEAGDNALIGPHRKRPTTGNTNAIGAPQVGISTSSSRNSQSDRSSPYRTTRRSNRCGGTNATSAAILGAGVSSSATSTTNSASIYNSSGTIPTGVAASSGRSNVPSPEANDREGCNSEDEYDNTPHFGEKGPELMNEIEQKFADTLMSTKGLRIKKMKDDGACLFRAVADQVYGDEEMHGVVRKLCMDHITKNADYFTQFMTEDLASYVERKRQDTAHGNHIEMQAMAEMFNRPIEVYQYQCEPINTFHSAYQTDNPAIRVSYHGNVHYNSVVDPHAATIGVGLGLPQYYPGLADKNLMRDAVHASEKHAIEEAMLEDKLRATDWEATDEQLQEQVARESYLQWLRDQEKQMKEIAATRGGVSTATANVGGSHLGDYSRPSCSKSPNRLHHYDSGDAASGSVAGSSRYYGAKRWDDEDDMLKQVLALSQQEYFDSLKGQRHDEAETKKSPPYSPS